MRVCTISNEYIDYLSKFDSRVFNNVNVKYSHTRKYLGIGIIIGVEGIDYFIPFSSPKNSDYLIDKNGNRKIRKSVLPIIRMTEKVYGQDKLLGTLRISNMIPAFHDVLEDYDIDNEEDFNYKKLVMTELEFIRSNEKLIINNANELYKERKYENNTEKYKYLLNCVDFKLLEEKCLEYKEMLKNH